MHISKGYPVASDELTGSERLILLVLMAQTEETSNTRLSELGPKLDKPSRAKLNRLRLIESDTTKRPMVHTLTDKGWAECARELKNGAPRGAAPQARGFYAVLSGLQRYLDREDLRPAHVFRANSPAAKADLPSNERERTGVRPPSSATALPTTSIEGQVRAAYSRMCSRAGAWVSLRDIRSELHDIPKPKLDRALGDMYREDDVSLIAEENQKALEDSVRGAAITIAGRPVHMIAIEG